MPTAKKAPTGAPDKKTLPAPAAEKKTPAPAAVIRFADVEKLNEKQRIERFAVEATAGQRAFSTMGKLFRALQRDLKAPKTVFGELQKAGVKKGSISNASYAAKVFDLVKPGAFTEAQYDSFTFGDCVSIVRVTSSGSKKRLSPEEAAKYVTTHADFEEDFNALAAEGITAAERADAKAEADKKAAEAAKAAPTPAQVPAKEAPTPAPAPAAPVKAQETAADAPEPPKMETPAPIETPANVTAMPSPPAAPTPVQQPEASSPPANSTPLPAPAQAPKSGPGAKDAIDLLNGVREILKTLSNLEAKPVIERLIDMADEGFGLTAEGGANRVDVLAA